MAKVARIDRKKIPLDSDILFYYSTTETYKAFRSFNDMTDKQVVSKDQLDGYYKSDRKNDLQQNITKACSWWVYALTEEIQKLRENESIEIHQLLVRVNRKTAMFSLDDSDHGQAPEIKSTLLKELHLSKHTNKFIKRKYSVKDLLR